MDETDIHRNLNEILNLRSLVTLIPDSKHNNADAISRCFNPHYCSCDMEIFKCLPCKKRLSRATLSIESEQNNSISTPSDTAKKRRHSEKARGIFSVRLHFGEANILLLFTGFKSKIQILIQFYNRTWRMSDLQEMNKILIQLPLDII